MKEEISLDIAMSKEEMAKIKELLTSSPGLRHYGFQLKKGEYLDLVEYKDYEKLEEENKSLQSQLKVKEKVIKEAMEYVEKYDVFKEFYFPLMKRDVENQIKSSIKYEFDTSIKKNLLEILSKGENK